MIQEVFQIRWGYGLTKTGLPKLRKMFKFQSLVLMINRLMSMIDRSREDFLKKGLFIYFQGSYRERESESFQVPVSLFK